MNKAKEILAMITTMAFAGLSIYGIFFGEGETLKQGIIYSSVFGLMTWTSWTEYATKEMKGIE